MKFAVIGAGQMGTGIAQVAAQVAKLPRVLLYDNNTQQLTRQLKNIQESLGKAAGKGKITNHDAEQTIQRITTTSRIEDLSDCDFIVEVSKRHN